MGYVYCHFKEDTNEPFYVGIGTTRKRHLNLSKRSIWHKRIAAKHGVRVEIIADSLTRDAACWWEKRWIKALRQNGYRICNITDGGDGMSGHSHTKEYRRQISDRMKKRNPMQDPEIAKKVSGVNHPSKKEGWISPNAGKPNPIAAQRMLKSNPMFDRRTVEKVMAKRKENGVSWRGDKNPSFNVTAEQLSQRGKKSAATRLLQGIVIPSNSRKVICETDKKIFESLCAASRFYNLSPQGIGKVCLGKRKSIKGLHFSYVTGEP